MEKTAMKQALEFGDQVRHSRMPEWGVGSVVKVEQVLTNGSPVLRVTVRFPNEGLKTLSVPPAELERVKPGTNGAAHVSGGIAPAPVTELDRMRDSGWLGELPQRKIDELMTSLSADVKDPFISVQRRLGQTLGLYRFDKSGKGLLDWAVSQTGLNDPLARFNRAELERYFDRWCFERESHLNRLLQELRHDRAAIDAASRSCPPAGAAALQRLLAVR